MRNNIPGLLKRLPDGAPSQFATDISAAHGIAERFSQQAATIRGNQNLTAKGKADAMREALKTGFGGHLTQIHGNLARASEDVARRRAALLTPKALDRSDLVGEMQRRELRDVVKATSIYKTNMPLDPMLIEAIALAPAILSGVDPEVHESCVKALAKTQHGEDAFRQLDEMQETINTANAALALAGMDMQNESGLALQEYELAAFGEAEAA